MNAYDVMDDDTTIRVRRYNKSYCVDFGDHLWIYGTPGSWQRLVDELRAQGVVK